MPETLQRIGAEQRVSRLYERPEDLIADPEIDIVDICTPNNYHTPLAVAAPGMAPVFRRVYASVFLFWQEVAP